MTMTQNEAIMHGLALNSKVLEAMADCFEANPDRLDLDALLAADEGVRAARAAQEAHFEAYRGIYWD